MRITVIGAGAMGASYGALLARAGHEVLLVDTWEAHVAAIRERGLELETPDGSLTVRVPAATGVGGAGTADVAIVFVDANATGEAAGTALAALAPEGFAVTFQNGIGNVETLQAALGARRVLGGSSMCSAAVRGPGAVALTHVGPTSVGEIDGSVSPRARDLAAALDGAGLPASAVPDIVARIWSKLVLNCAVNPLCAATGLRMGEVARLPELAELQRRVLDEAFAVAAARGVALDETAVRRTVESQCRAKFSRPSMLQHVEAGRRTEIDAINGALVREARALGIPVPCNEAVVALLKGRELKRRREVHEPDLDYDAWEARVAAGEE